MHCHRLSSPPEFDHQQTQKIYISHQGPEFLEDESILESLINSENFGDRFFAHFVPLNFAPINSNFDFFF
jgi:hypothetical protein